MLTFKYTIEILNDGEHIMTASMLAVLSDTSVAFQQIVNQMVGQFSQGIAEILIAIVFIIIGWFIGIIFKKIVSTILERSNLDEWAKEHDLPAAIGNHSYSMLAGSFVKWYVILLFLTQASEFVHLAYLRVVLDSIVYFIPLVLGALFIMVFGLTIGRFVKLKITQTQHRFKESVGLGAELFIIYLSAVISLQTIGFDATILVDAFRIAFAAFLLTLAIILGVSFGLAFKNDMADMVDTIKRGQKEFGKR